MVQKCLHSGCTMLLSWQTGIMSIVYSATFKYSFLIKCCFEVSFEVPSDTLSEFLFLRGHWVSVDTW